MDLQQKAIRLGLDLQGGIHVVLRVKTEEVEGDADEAVQRAMQVIRTRIDGLGVAEPNIQKQSSDRIIIDLPGYTDADRAEDLVGQMAVLEFKLLENYDNATLLLRKIDSVIHDYEVALSGDTIETEPAETEEVAEETADSLEEEVDVMAEMMGDTALDTTDFGFDEEIVVSEELTPFTSRLDPMLFHDESRTWWPGYPFP